jgi:fructokinase
LTYIDNTAPVIVGEVLFDTFPDGTTVLGGAPFNVAWHLQGFGLSPLMISSVGNDEHGKHVLESMRDWHMDTHGIQVNNEYPTGEVVVSITDGQPGFNIKPDQAYDFIDADQALALMRDQDYALLYHGSLITRTPRSRQMLDALLNTMVLPSFVDINLRPPWWNKDDLHTSLSQASWVKLNEDELLTIMEVDSDSTEKVFQLARDFLDKYEVDMVIVTQGEHGAFCVTKEDAISGAPVKANIVDTVGAGDAFSSVMIMGLLHGWPLPQSLERALQFAAIICEQRGATTMDRALYASCLEQWT